MIKAPFNFVPLSDQVVFPEWAEQISHDVPFSDGISGEISVTLTAETPIFVADGHSQNDKRGDNDNPATFSKIGDRYFLPSTTVKGAIRNVLEILSFSKMTVDPNALYSFRDLYHRGLYNLLNDSKNIHCGWLRKKDGNNEDSTDSGFEIIDCGEILRISHTEIDKYLGKPIFEGNFSNDGNKTFQKRKDNLKKDEDKTAEFKYKLLTSCGKTLDSLRGLRFERKGKNRNGQTIVSINPNGNIKGTLVVTGQPNKWKKRGDNKGKAAEFVFPEPKSNALRYNIDAKMYDQYKFMYADSSDWVYFNKDFLKAGSPGIPVFFRINESGDTLLDWGLSFMYKLPYKRSVFEALPAEHQETTKPDLAECIFGYTEAENNSTSEKREALKGRVQFSHFMSKDAKPTENPVQLILSGPKASYYPIYINQNGRGKDGNMYKPYLTFNDGHPTGWKRYLLRKDTWEKTATPTTDSYIHPVDRGATFEGKVRFHNLRPIELGALLSALTFHSNEKDCRHQIGMAKPYGYGKVSVEIKELQFTSVGRKDNKISDRDGYMRTFENYMNNKLKDDKHQYFWNQRNEIKELFAIARHDAPDSEEFKYMELDEYRVAKRKGSQCYLERYRKLVDHKFTPRSLSFPYKKKY